LPKSGAASAAPEGVPRLYDPPVASFRDGKIDSARRIRIVAEFMDVDLKMTREQISDFCVASLANVLRMPKEKIKTDAKFNRLGLDSAMVVYVLMELEEKLGLELSPDDFYDYPTVDDLSRYLAEKHAARPAA
jgi:acyl carrier protein